MKLSEIRELLFLEMSIARGAHLSYWHGTTGEAGRKIARDGKLLSHDVVDPKSTRSRSGLVPQKGKTYLGDLQVGLTNAIFRARGGGKSGEAALVEVEASKMGAYAPDEDEVADLLEYYVLYRDMSFYNIAVRDVPVVKAFREKHKAFKVRRDQLDRLPDDVADVMRKALPIEDVERYALGRELADRYVEGYGRLRSRWEKAQSDSDGSYEHFTWLGKKVLAKIRPGDRVMDDLVARSNRLAHEGEVSVKRVLVFRTDGLPQSWEDEKLRRLTVKDVEEIAEELRPTRPS
jgi:hypothetical protein